MALQEELKTQGDYLFRNRSYLPLIILVVGMLVFIQTKYYQTGVSDTWISGYFEYICLGISLFGLFIRIFIVGYTPENTSGRNTKDGQIANELNTTGMYSIARHPLYIGNFFMWLGIATLTENGWFIVAFTLAYVLYYERIMYTEEDFLRNKFGDMYLKWAEKTPAFIPSFKGFKKTGHPFSTRKILKKEKNGFAAIFVLFWVFKLIGDSVENRGFVLEYDFWFFAAILSTIIYFILKVMKKKKMLD